MNQHRQSRGETTPDLFTTGAKHPSTERRYILPNDLPSALTNLNEDELGALARAVKEEIGRRHSPSKFPAKAERAADMANKRQLPKREALPLTKSRISAIRAALKAGVKPKVIARQFGLTLSAIQRALSDKSD